MTSRIQFCMHLFTRLCDVLTQWAGSVLTGVDCFVSQFGGWDAVPRALARVQAEVAVGRGCCRLGKYYRAKCRHRIVAAQWHA